VPTESTVVYVAYDDAALYIGARLYDSHPDSIVARLARRDQGTSSDRFQVYIDSYHDKRSGFFFGTMRRARSTTARFSTTTGRRRLDGCGREGYSGRLGMDAELRIPYSQLRFVQSSQYVWASISAAISRAERFDYIVYTPRDGRGFVSGSRSRGIERITPRGAWKSCRTRRAAPRLRTRWPVTRSTTARSSIRDSALTRRSAWARI